MGRYWPGWSILKVKSTYRSNDQDITCFYTNICKILTTLYLINQFCGPGGSLMTHLTDFLQFVMIITCWEVILHLWCHFVDWIQEVAWTYVVISKWAEWVVNDPNSLFLKSESHTVLTICFKLMLQLLFYPNVFASEVIAQKPWWVVCDPDERVICDPSWQTASSSVCEHLIIMNFSVVSRKSLPATILYSKNKPTKSFNAPIKARS